MTTKESKTFVSLWLRKDLSDVTLKLESQEIEVHKMVLAAGSEYFDKLFFGSFVERDLAEVELKEDNEHAVKIIVFWMYGIEVELRPSLSEALRPRHDHLFWAKELIDIYIVADKYCVHDLVEKVIENLQQEFNNLDLEKFTAFIDLIYTNRDNYPDKLSERVDSELLGPTISQRWASSPRRSSVKDSATVAGPNCTMRSTAILCVSEDMLAILATVKLCVIHRSILRLAGGMAR